MWDSRLSWAGEFPATLAVVHQRFDSGIYGSGSELLLPAAAGPDWELINSASTTDLFPGRWGNNFRANTFNPSSERTELRVPYFSGLWPSSGKVVAVVWAALTYAMTFTPLITTRNSSPRTPLIHFATQNDGRPRHQVFDAAGNRILDQIESLPWSVSVGAWQCYIMCVDLDASTSQVAVITRDGNKFISPLRSFSGIANKACTADLSVFSLYPNDSYWASGYADEIGLFHATPDFSLSDFAEQVRLATWARGTDNSLSENLIVTDTAVTATGPATLFTGAQPASWETAPVATPNAQLQSEPLAILSTDNGSSWSAPTPTASLPAPFDGLLRWQVSMQDGEIFTGMTLEKPRPVPILDPIPSLTLTQRSQAVRSVSGTWQGVPVVSVSAPSTVDVIVSGLDLIIQAGMSIGEFEVAVYVTDGTGQTSEPVALAVTVDVDAWDPPDTPVFAHAPLIIHDEAGDPSELIVDPLSAVILREINGAQTLSFSVPANHPKASLLVPERGVTAAQDVYRIRRIETSRTGGVPVLEVYAEARFYDLGVAGHVDEYEFTGTQAGVALEHVLTGTGWTVGNVNVTTVRSWVMERASVLACLRAIAKVHGGDLVFDNHARTVSLVTAFGHDRGVGFFYGHGLNSASRVVDTTSLLTRIVPRNADGVGIEAVNGGVPYLEDFSFSSEVRTGEYHYASGTSPLTMLALTQANLGNRSRPKYSYEAQISDLSSWTGQEIDRFDVGDRVTIIDDELGISTEQRIVSLEYDLLRPWASKVVLSEKLRELGSADSATDAGVLTTGTDIDTRDLVPFNLLFNGRFDNGLAHWASSGADVISAGVTGLRSVEFTGPGTKWIEQTVATDTREAYTLSLQVASEGPTTGWVPDLVAEIEIVYDDDSTETIGLELI